MLLPWCVEPVDAGQSDSETPRTPWGVPDLQGVWDFRSATPLERPAEFEGQDYLDPLAAAEFEATALERLEASSQTLAGQCGRGGALGRSWNRARRGQPDRAGRRPPRTAASRTGPRRDRPGSRRSDRSLAAPLTPTYSNNNIQIFQTPDLVVVYLEMVHDVRMVPLDGRRRLPSRIRQWRGDARGWWEGETLVVETTNFSDASTFFGTGPSLRLTERFTRLSEDELHYEFTIDDPASFARPWTAMLPMRPTQGGIFEYACHEGNRGMENILIAARLAERDAP